MRIALLPLEDPAAESLLTSLAEHERFASWHLAWPDGRISSRGAAGFDLLRALGYSRAASAVARFTGPTERLYGFVAAHRDRLGALAPDGPAPRRYP